MINGPPQMIGSTPCDRHSLEFSPEIDLVVSRPKMGSSVERNVTISGSAEQGKEEQEEQARLPVKPTTNTTLISSINHGVSTFSRLTLNNTFYPGGIVMI